MPLIIVILGVALLLLLVTVVRLNTIFSLLITSVAVGFAMNMSAVDILKSVENGVSTTMGQLALLLAFGSLLGKLMAEGGAAEKITTVLTAVFGKKNLPWAMVLTGFLVGIPLFYNVGFIVLVPFVFMVCVSNKMPLLYIAMPLLAALSVTHGYLPPHPGATAIALTYKADIGLTMVYGIIVAIPAIIMGGPLFGRMLKHIPTNPPTEFFPEHNQADRKELPGFAISIFTGLFPIILIAFGSFSHLIFPEGSSWLKALRFLGDPVVALMIASLMAMYTMGIRQGKSLREQSESVEEAIRGIMMILFIIAASGAFKQILVDSGVANYIADITADLSLSPLVLAWLIAGIIRLVIGSASVAGLTAAGIMLPIVQAGKVTPELMVLATGAGSLMFSHVNDPGFWMFKSYFGVSMKDTFRSWTVMETLVSVVGLIGVLILHWLGH
ncbi:MULTISPECIES: gluconate:H+ symporter [Sphingobacterium]|uniref:gluconate:H+ symporter n=1 Tax=Sphingobacterium TaxID=28453 RepID=UPI000E9FA59D|nr:MULTISPECIES: gluconate:H+ symporter [Sphingobacterium]HAL51874.1 gluconate transporter [Sphingobacterium sp.]HAU55211.1 gluconate transporter [Sphingobacterium sp.]HCX57140.1 gluconate transporter [Sphingobacterium sp.]